MARLSVSSRAAVLSWLFLVLATLATSWVAEQHTLNARWAVTIVIVFAALKARVILLHYMELKHAPLAWRVAFELWGVVASLLMLVGWLLSDVEYGRPC
jgi:heme/copper-type cytochrome/quinol oxidase subunit 4